MDSLMRSEYADKILPALSPNDAVAALKDRLALAGQANTEIAEWVEERARIEQTYATSLARLSSRRIAGDVAAVGLGTFQDVWTKFIESTSSLAGSSQSFANKLSADIATPVRKFATVSREWAEMEAIQENLSSVAHNIESAEDKVEKYKKKGSSKISGAHDNVNNAIAEWDSQAPLVFEKLQGIDSSRLVMLKDVLTRYQTSEVDKAQRLVSLCEANLNSLLSFDPDDEIKIYAMQIQTNGAPRSARTSSRNPPPPPPPHQTHTAVVSSPASTVRSAVAAASPAFASPASKRRSSIATNESGGSTPTTGKSRFGRMSTMLRSNKDGKRSLFGHKDKDSKKYLERFDVSPVRDSRRQSVETSSITSNQSRASRPEPVRNTTSGAVPVVASTPVASPTVATPPPVAIPNPYNSNSSANGKSHDDDPDAINVIGTIDSIRMPTTTPAVARVDSEGYSIPPPVAKDPMIASLEDDLENNKEQSNLNVNIQPQQIKDEQDEAQAAVEHVAASLRAKPTVSGRSTRGRRGESKQYSTPPLDAAFLQTGHGGPPPPPPHRGEHASTVEEKSPTSIAEEKVEEVAEDATPEVREISEKEALGAKDEPDQNASVIETAGGQPVLSPIVTAKDDNAEPQLESATQQFYSSVSSPSVPEGQDLYPSFNKGPETVSDTEEEAAAVVTGSNNADSESTEDEKYEFISSLSGSVLETVSAIIQGGTASRVMVLGEVALSLPSEVSATTPVRLRVGDSSKFQRLLPNESLLSPGGTEGEYVLDAATLSAAPGIAFKFSITSHELAPIVLEPIWKFESHQASLLMYYFMNAEYPVDTITLSGFSIEVAIEGAATTACRSKPSGLFEQEAGKLVIPITGEGEEITLRKSDEKVQVLVRFLTEGVAREAGSGGVVVNFRYSPVKEVSACDLAVLDASKKKKEDTADPFADEGEDEGEWVTVPVVRSVVSGRYLAIPASSPSA